MDEEEQEDHWLSSPLPLPPSFFIQPVIFPFCGYRGTALSLSLVHHHPLSINKPVSFSLTVYRDILFRLN